MLPIRKTSSNQVALSSYYGPKLFITRGNKKMHDYGEWLCNQIRAIGLDINSQVVTDLRPGSVFDSYHHAPRMFTILSQRFGGFTLQGFHCMFDHKKEEEFFGKDVMKTYLSSKVTDRVLIGKADDGRVLLIDEHGKVYIGENGLLRVNGTIESMLGIENAWAAPIDYVDMKVLDKNLPLAIILSYEMGFENLLNGLKVSYERAGSTRHTKTDDTYTIVFNDETFILNREDRMASLIMAGWREYRDFIKSRSYLEFNKKDIYLNLLESKKMTLRYLREIDLLYQMFIDPITLDILKQMKEPTNFRGLLLRATELLLTDWHPQEMDANYQRIKGNERIPGAMYRELIRAIRQQRGRGDKSRAPVELNPHAVWNAISQDPSKSLIDEINPIQALKEVEAVTYSGTGGRSSESMVVHTRVYSKHDMGTISEGSVDSGDVGINIQTSANPLFNSVLGTSDKFDLNNPDVTSLLSTSALLAPFSDHED